MSSVLTGNCKMPDDLPLTKAKPDFKVLQQAAEWFAVLRSPSVSASDVQQWRAWCDADSMHRIAWARVEEISGRFEQVPEADKPHTRATLDIAAQRQRNRRRALKMLSLLCTAGSASWLASQVMPWQAWNASYRTATGERRQVQLADGSNVWINTASAMDAEYGESLRRIRLYAGEILIETARDSNSPPRPFVVDTSQGRMRALGTRFGVRQFDGASHLAVYEGAVEVTPAEGGEAKVIHANQQVSFTAQGIDEVSPTLYAQQAWTGGMLVADNMRLEDLLAELSRYRHGHLGCDPAVADLRVVGAYSLKDPERILAALEETLPIRIRRTMSWWAVAEAR